MSTTAPTDEVEKGASNCPEDAPDCPLPEAAEPAETRYLFRRPQALQYFHRGVFKKHPQKERVEGRFELFFDLLFLANNSNRHVWADAKEDANNYYNDDLIQRVGILWLMALLVLYGNNAPFVADLERYPQALRITVGAYIVMRFTQVCYFFYASMASHHHRLQNRFYVVLTLITQCIWIPLFFDEVSQHAKIAVAVVGIVCEEVSYIVTFGPWIGRWFNLEYRSALDISHENERYTAFTIIVLGEFTYAILAGSPAEGGLNLNYMRAVWTLVIAFCFNSMYVYTDGALKSIHPARRSVSTAIAWLMIHLPMSAGLLIGGHTCAGATRVMPETMEHGEAVEGGEGGELGELGQVGLNEGQRWLLGGGLAVGFLCLWLMALLFEDGDPKGRLLLPKNARVGPRLIAAIIVALLPLASPERLDDTAMLSTIAGVSVIVVLWEMIGGLEKLANLFEPWSNEDFVCVEVVQ